MARGVNKVILLGNLGRDPELSYTPNGLAVAKFTLATTERRKVKEEWQDQTEWHRITAFGKTAEVVGQYLSKGKQVFIEARITYGSYEKDGVTRYTTDIIVSNLQMLGRADGQGGSETPPESRFPSPGGQAVPEDDIEDDLPF